MLQVIIGKLGGIRMSDYTIEQLIDPNDKDIADVLNLFRGIPGRTCTVAAYLDYINTNWMLIAIFVVRKNQEVVGFTQAEAPCTLDPKCAWLPFSHATPQCPHKQSQKALQLAIEWMKGFGATKFKYATVRNPAAIKRHWGMKRSKEVLMEKDI